MVIKLPNGFIDGGDHFTHARVDELRGKQQNYLSNKELVVGNIGHIPKILEDLVLSLETEQGLKWNGDIKEAIYKLPAGDLETILIKIRQNTYGPKYYHDQECPHCKHINKDLRIDLDKLELKIMPLADILNHSKRTITLPKSGLDAELKPLYLKDLFQAVKIATDKNDELITSALALTIKKLGDKSKISPKDLEEMSMTDIICLNEFAESCVVEGNIDNDVTTDCTKCKKEFTYRLNVYDPSFFYPTKVSKNTST